MTGSWHGGKGDRIRPFNRKKWDNGWERAFGDKSNSFFESIWELDEILKEANEKVENNAIH